MQQQPLLTAYEARRLVSKEVPEHTWSLVIDYVVGRDYELGEIEKYLIPEMDIVVCCHLSEEYGCIFASPHFIEMLTDCANRLRIRGYYVFLRLEFDNHLNLYICDFVVGECGRLLDKIYSLAKYLNDLKEFVDKQKQNLPPNLVAEQSKIEDYLGCLWGAYKRVLEEYTKGRETSLKEECEEVWKLVKEVEAYLDCIKDLQRLFAISLIL
jgi:hypothetical protein